MASEKASHGAIAEVWLATSTLAAYVDHLLYASVFQQRDKRFTAKLMTMS